MEQQQLQHQPLGKHKKTLVPEDRQLALVADKLVEVEHQSINHTVRQSVFLVKQNAQEYAVGSCY